MAPTPVTTVEPTRDGVAAAVPDPADPVNGNSVPNTDSLHLVLNNTDAAPADVVFTTPDEYAGFDVADFTVTLAAGETRHFGGFSQQAFGGSLVFTATTALVEIAAYV